jgi:hypothetical protein
MSSPLGPLPTVDASVASFAVFGPRISIRSTEPIVVDSFRRLYRHFPETDSPAGAYEVEIVKHAGGGSVEWEAIVAGERRMRDARLDRILHQAESVFCTHVLLNATHLIGLHVATVCLPDGVALITGDSGVGKTTLTLTLSAKGYPVDGDDMALLDPETSLVWGLPRCFHLDDRAVDMVAEQGLPVAELETSRGFLTPSDIGDGGTAARPVKAVFFLLPDDLAQPAVEPLTMAETAAKLERQSGPRDRPATELFTAFSKMLDRARCFRLRRGPLGPTADAVCEILRGLSSTTGRR